ncbi:MAG: ABC transporter permease [Chlorobi bacterium]|nr:ABC transporter permease [Chlorobiota bacterium]
MNKISIIILREYLTRVKKKTFLIMSIVGPLLFAALMIAPAWLAQMEDKEEKLIAVIDSSKLFYNTIPETKYLKFEYLQNTPISKIKQNFSKTNYYAVLYISHIVTYKPNAVQLFSDKQPSLAIKMHISNALEKEIERLKLKTYNIENLDNILQSIKTNISIQSIKLAEDGTEKKSSVEIAMIVGYLSGFLIYLFIFLFGAQVMRGVIEEKTNRIIEVVISSVKPFQLMMGKIVGIAMVGLTQFLLWIILTAGIVTVVKTAFFPELSMKTEQITPETVLSSGGSTLQPSQPVNDAEIDQVKEIFSSVKSINFGVLFASFIFFFLGGFLLYGSLFAAVGAAVDSETDTQQFMLPITIPLILAIIVMMNAIQNPEGPIAFWFSIIPFTSPIVMMVRIPFGVPYWEVSLSVILLVITFIFTTWLASKIYRTGILMYGKKTSYKEIWKWLRYNN